MQFEYFFSGRPADPAVVNTYADQLFKTSSSHLGSQVLKYVSVDTNYLG